ncbi:hypothetical protein FQN57_005158 [Myotisia sp. PD_48]|nr:hypothetical protein FQN57_005158 [Myotisia sp. PD_48]
MSEAQKPVEVTPVVAAVTETPTTTTEVAATPEASAAVDAPAVDAEAGPETPAKDEVKAEVTPATDGVLGYKAPGLVKGFRFAKRHFWFSDEAVEIKHLSGYFQNEKLSLAHPTAAWASQTGKGLLFFAKRAEDKANPTGIINLTDISDLTKEGVLEFSFKSGGHRHAFNATTTAERDSWFVAVEAKSAEGKAEKEAIVGGEGYKAELEKLTKPAVVAPVVAVAKKSTEDKQKEPEVQKEAETSPAPKEDKKSRSQSRKRASIFGSFLGKKEEVEEKKEEKKEAKEEEKADDKDAKKDVAEAAPVEPAVAPEVSTEAPKEVKPEEKKPEVKAETPAPKSKRSSIFGSFFQKVTSPTQEKTEKEATATKPAETAAVSSTAPQLGDPVDASTSAPIKPESVTSPAATTEQPKEQPKETEETSTSPSTKILNFIKKEIKHEDKKEVKPEPEKKVEETATKTEEAAPAAAAEPAPAVPSKEKRRTSLFGSLTTSKKEKTEGENADGEKSKSPISASKFTGIFRKPSKAVKKDKEAAPAATESEPIAEGTEKPTEAPATDAANGDASEVKKAEETPAAPAEDSAAASAQPVKAAA